MKQYPFAGPVVSGLRVRAHVPNMGSIGASLDDWEELPGIREVPFDAFGLGELRFYSVTEEKRTKELAREIKTSGELNPLIVVIDEEGPYVLEGAHRFDALRMLKIGSFPAKVVVDRTAQQQKPARENPPRDDDEVERIITGQVPMFRGARAPGPIKGPTYFASMKNFAKTYGPTTEVRLHLERPLIVTQDEWKDVEHGFASVGLLLTAEMVVENLKARGDYDSAFAQFGTMWVAFVVDGKKATAARARENPPSGEAGGGLICMGREVEFVLKDGREIKAKQTRDGMLRDPSGTYWPKCSLLIAPFENGTEASKQAGNYFGRDAEVFEGRVDLPPQSLGEWQELGEVREIFYDRAGTKHPGFFRHEFHKPRGMYKLVFLIKGRAAKEPAVLYQHGDYFRLDLPKGCVVDDRGIVVP